MFIGRKKEMKVVDRFFSDSSQAMMMYGRKRIGKTALIKHALSRYAGQFIPVYFECKRTYEQDNTEALAELLSDALSMPNISFRSFEQLLLFAQSQAQEKPLVLVLDEYPYLRDIIPGMDSILQSVLDNDSKNGKFKMIVAGSYVDIMKSIIENSNPLHGRFSYQLKLQPMDYLDSSLFYPAFSPADKVILYSVFGGVPYYNSLISDKISAVENIQRLIASENAQLSVEISQLLYTEIGKISNADAVFETLAAGVSRFSDIQSKAHIQSPKTLSETLKKLIEMDLVVKDNPINDPRNPKKTRYFIQDPLSMFYYRYIFPNRSRLAVLDENLFFRLLVEEDFDSQYVPRFFERICREFLIRKNNSEEISPPFFEIGKYYYDDPVQKKNGEFENVTQDKNGYIFYESKYWNRPLDRAAMEKEIRQVTECGLACTRFGFFSKSGYEDLTEFPENWTCYSLEDLFMTDAPDKNG